MVKLQMDFPEIIADTFIIRISLISITIRKQTLIKFLHAI